MRRKCDCHELMPPQCLLKSTKGIFDDLKEIIISMTNPDAATRTSSKVVAEKLNVLNLELIKIASSSHISSPDNSLLPMSTITFLISTYRLFIDNVLLIAILLSAPSHDSVKSRSRPSCMYFIFVCC